MTPMYEAIIFDMDGVLWNSMLIHKQAFDAALSEYSLGEVDVLSIAGVSTAKSMRRILASHGLDHDRHLLNKLVQSKRRFALEMLEENPPLAPGCCMVLLSLAKMKMGLATSGSRDSTTIFLKATQSGALFSSIITGDDVDNAKPSPDIFNYSMKNLGVTNQSTLIVEDSMAGIEAGLASGAHVAALVGTHTRDELQRSGANYILTNLGDVLKYANCDTPH